MPFGADFLKPFDPVARPDYLMGFTKPTLGAYNNRCRSFGKLDPTEKRKEFWVAQIVAREKDLLSKVLVQIN